MNVFETVADFFFPQKCAACNYRPVNGSDLFCQNCHESLRPWSYRNRCSVCGAGTTGECPECAEREWFFNRAQFAMQYRGRTASLLKAAKFQNRRKAVSLINENIDLNAPSDALLLPLPSSSELVGRAAEYIAQKNNLQLKQVFRFEKKGRTKKLNRAERFRQLEESLQLKKDLPAASSFIIFDDVWTSGATVNRAARLLSEQGIERERISVYCIFRRDSHRDLSQSR